MNCVSAKSVTKHVLNRNISSISM